LLKDKKSIPNDGLTLLRDVIAPNSLTIIALGSDHFFAEDPKINAKTIALTILVISYLEGKKHSNWCRWLCPYGQTFGVLNKAGFYKIKADKEKCISCGICIKECDMGIPVQHLVETKGEVNVPDCVGCGRCITNCPKEVLSFSDH
jgi:polyferredoxin